MLDFVSWVAKSSHRKIAVSSRYRVELFEQIIAQSLEHDWIDATGSSALIRRCFDTAKIRILEEILRMVLLWQPAAFANLR